MCYGDLSLETAKVTESLDLKDLHKSVHGMVELHQHHKVHRKTRAAVTGGRVHGQPGQTVVRFQHVPENTYRKHKTIWSAWTNSSVLPIANTSIQRLYG